MIHHETSKCDQESRLVRVSPWRPYWVHPSPMSMPLEAFDRQCHSRSHQTWLSGHWSHGGSAFGNCKRMIEYTSLKPAPYSQGTRWSQGCEMTRQNVPS